MRSEIDVLNPVTYGEGDPLTNGMPWAHYEWLRENAPCYHQTIGDPLLVSEAWVLSRYEDVALVDRDTRRFTSDFGPTLRLNEPSTRHVTDRPVMMSIDGPDHTRVRKVVARGLRPGDIAALETRIRELCHELLDHAQERGIVEFMSEIGSRLPLQVICELVGIPDGPERDRYHESVGIVGDAGNPKYAQDPMQVLGAAQFVYDYASELAEVKRACPAADLMSRVVAAHDAETLSRKELEAMLLMLGLGGDETTRNALGHSLFAFHRFPEQWELLCEAPERHIDSCVEEILRWSTPVVGVRRTTTEDVEFHGVMIRAGEPVSALYASANFDPDVFDHPYEFDITRSPNRHLSFGNGPHVCLGAALGRLDVHAGARGADGGLLDTGRHRLPRGQLSAPGRADDHGVPPQSAIRTRPDNGARLN